MKHLGDITKINGAEIPVVDIITGGSPCQDLSVAGLRKGIQHGELGDEETTRSGLFMDQLRIVKEMRANDIRNGRSGVDVRPRYMVWENVPGAFSVNQGKDFQAVLTEIVRVIEPTAPDVPLPEKGWPYAGCIALPFWAWLFRRINAHYERPATMGSLFDGIGGFPLTALRSGIKPLWASEIEAFPIAVVKKHFGDEHAGTKGDIWKYL